MLIDRRAKSCAVDTCVVVQKSEGASSHLPGLDLVLVVILKDAFIAQTQPPRDPLLVLQHTTKIPQEKVSLRVGQTERYKNKNRSKDRYRKKCTLVFSSILFPNSQAACLQVLSEQKCVWCVCVCVCVKKRKGRVVKLYLNSIVMYSICGQRLYNAHITVRSRKTDM